VAEPILKVRDLTTRFRLVERTITAVAGVSFDVQENEILAIVGESGCGKSVTILSLMNLIQPPGFIDPASRVLFEGRNLLELEERELAAVRGGRIAMVFQEPSASFNLLFTVGAQIAEALRIHRGLSREKALEQARDLLRQVRIPAGERRARDYPFQLSGGMLQRSMIALALSCSPSLLLADEPTTALDATVQAQILALLKEKSSAGGMSVIFVTHDFALIDGFANRVIIMYAGRILECCSSREILEQPAHPYTQDLLKAIPRLGVFKDEQRLYSIAGRVPEPGNLPSGCTYAPRCRLRFGKCEVEPELLRAGGNGKKNHTVRCWLFA